MLTKKIILAGHFGVGKTSLIKRFVLNEFSKEYLITIGVQISKKELFVNNTKINLIIWDIEGKETIENMRKSYLLGTHAFIFVIDSTRSSTFENFESEINFIKSNFKNCPLVVVANKTDIQPDDTFLEFLENHKQEIDFNVSAKNGQNVENTFLKIANLLIELNE